MNRLAGVVLSVVAAVALAIFPTFNPTWDGIVTQTVSGADTIGNTSRTVFVSAGGAYALMLPTAAGIAGVRLSIVCDSSVTVTNVVTVTPAGAETIDGYATLPLFAPYTEVVVVSDGTGWRVESGPDSPWSTFTPTGLAWTTNTTTTGKIRVAGGRTYQVQLKAVLAGAPDTATFAFDAPIAPDEASLFEGATNQTPFVGWATLRDASNPTRSVPALYNWAASGDPLSIYLFTDNTLATPAAVTQAAPWTWASGDYIIAIVTLPY